MKKKHNHKITPKKNKKQEISPLLAIKKAHGKSEYAVEMLNITKTFDDGALKANDDLTLRVKYNEIHALVGENGAGKTTLMRILFGLTRPDTGTIKINGQEIRFKSPNDATKAGIGMVHQHFKLINVYSLLDNIMLGAEKTKNGFLDRHSARKKIQELSERYKLPVNLDNKVNSASVGEQQRTEILKLLYRDSDILIFDEPTAVLSDQEIKGFLQMLKEFKKQGKTIIIITHKLNEVKAVADRATIIRKGCFIKTIDVKRVSSTKIANLMVGRKLVLSKNQSNDKQYMERPLVCSIKNLCAYKISKKKVLALDHLNLNIHEGEIVGIAGVEGNGQTELALVLGGLLKSRVSGDVKIYNSKTKESFDVLKSSVHTLYEAGISHIPEDRLKYGLLLDETVAINAVLPQINHHPFSIMGFVNNRAITNYAKGIINQWDVRGANNGRALARALSGGNQQKLVIGRELSRKHHFSIFVQPTRGLDLGAIQYVHDKILEDAKKGAGILLISYELDEILAISSRIAVMNRGKIVFNALRNNTDRAEIGAYMTDGAKKSGNDLLSEQIKMNQIKATETSSSRRGNR